MPLPFAYLIDALAQRWSTNPVWIEEACPWYWRDIGFEIMRAESDAHAIKRERSSKPDTESTGTFESVGSVKERRERIKRRVESRRQRNGDE